MKHTVLPSTLTQDLTPKRHRWQTQNHLPSSKFAGNSENSRGSIEADVHFRSKNGSKTPRIVYGDCTEV